MRNKNMHLREGSESAGSLHITGAAHGLLLTLSMLLGLLMMPAQLMGVQAACNVMANVDLVFQDDPPPVGQLYEAANRITSGEYDVVPEHRERLSRLLSTFADYLSGNSSSVVDIFQAYDDALVGILDSPTYSTGTPAGQRAMRTTNQIARLFSALPSDVLDGAIDGEVWKLATYETRSKAFARNGLRTQLIAARNLDVLEGSNSVAFASAVRWNSETDVVFSGFYTNHPGVAGVSALPEDQAFWARGTGTFFTITDPDAYTNWLRDGFYSNGAQAMDPATAAFTTTDPLSDTMWQRIRNSVGGKTYNNRETGLPGTHAEVQAANALSEGLDPADTGDPRIGVHTVRSTRNPLCTGFECCAGCTDVLRGFARSTGGGGTLRDPFRR